MTRTVISLRPDAAVKAAAALLCSHGFTATPVVDAGGRLVGGRRPRTHTASDATAPIAEAMAQTAHPWPEAVCVPTHRTLAESLELASSVWRDATHSRPWR